VSSEAYEISSVRLKVTDGGSPGTVTVNLYADSGGSPSGSPLSTGSFDCEGASDTVENVSMSAYELTDATTYHLVPGFSIGDGCKILGKDFTSHTPQALRYNGSWAVMQPDVLYLEIYGEDIEGGDPDPPTATTSTSTIIIGNADNLFGLSILVFLGSVMFTGFMYNNLTDKKQKQWL